jgi:hypothetical protein
MSVGWALNWAPVINRHGGRNAMDVDVGHDQARTF